MKQLSFIDNAMMLPESPRTPNHLCMVGIYDPSTSADGRPSFAQLLDKIGACLPAAPALRQRLHRVPFGLDRPYWIDDVDFDLEFHVRHLALPAPGDWRQFCVQVARLHSRPLDLARSPWELTVIESLDGIGGLQPGCFATVLKIHHAAADGQSGVALLAAMHEFSADAVEEAVDDDWDPEPPPTSAELLRRAALNSVVNPVATVRTVVTNALPLIGELARSVRSPTASVAVASTRFNRVVSAHRVFDQAVCPLDDVKVVKNAVPGATVNDVCLSIIGGAMHDYLAEVGEEPAVPLVSLVPVSTRNPDDVAAGGNQVSGMRVSLFSDIADPLERVAAIAATTAAKKATQNGVAMPVLLDLAQVVPGAVLAAGIGAVNVLAARGAVVANTVVTNVPSSPIPMYLLGCELVESTGCVPLFDTIGLFHCVSSYAGVFRFMITADRDLLPDPEHYIECLDRSIHAHLSAARPVRTRARAPKTKPAGGGKRR